MTRVLPARWAVSFADLTLLMLGFFILLHAVGGRTPGSAPTKASTKATVAERAQLDLAAAELFEHGEARLTEAARADLSALAARLQARPGTVRIESFGRDSGSHRLDAWELAAARTAATARALREAGLDEARVELDFPEMGGEEDGPHRIRIRLISVPAG